MSGKTEEAINSVVVKEGHDTHTHNSESVPRHDVKAKRHTFTIVNSREDVVDDKGGCVTGNGGQRDIEPASRRVHVPGLV